jgi:WD40 repeat protein
LLSLLKSLTRKTKQRVVIRAGRPITADLSPARVVTDLYGLQGVEPSPRIVDWDSSDLNGSLTVTLVGHFWTADFFRVFGTIDYQDGVTVWDTDKGHARSSCKVNGVASVAFAPGGMLLDCGATDCNVWLCNPATGEAIGALRGHERCVFGLSFSPDGRTLASRD